MRTIRINGEVYAVPFAALLRPLTALELAELERSIAEEGEILEPVQTYISERWGVALLDGQHRAGIGARLGLDVPIFSRGRMTDADAKRRATALNVPRRHLTPEEQAAAREGRIAVERDRRARGESIRTIAAAVGVDPKQVRTDLAAASGGDRSPPETITGADGKQYPAARPRAKRKTVAGAAHQAALGLRKSLKRMLTLPGGLPRGADPRPLAAAAAAHGVPLTEDRWPALDAVILTLRDLS